MVTPNSGKTFGWLRDFHVTTSLQNLCSRQSSLVSIWLLALEGTHAHTRDLEKVAR